MEETMSDIYGDGHRAFQMKYDTVRLANRIDETIVAAEIAPDQRDFIESRDMFFLSSIDHRGFPTCSYKGGAQGFVRVLDPMTIAFPNYNGNGMFLSMGNISANSKVGMLFIDFETPHRMRVHGVATVDANDPLLAEFPGAELIVRTKVIEVFINCPRYVHRYQRLQTSKYAPQSDYRVPAPQWKRIDAIQDVLPAGDKNVAETLGGTITFEEYIAAVARGDG
jgi:predicted pyridoxine 5'-phosphate oxidase superfamily flavin-nucleotide-binding protein